MARYKSFTEEDVTKAAIELMEQGRDINGSSLRSVIGVGRPANILATYEKLASEGRLDEYRQEPVEEKQEKEYELPQEVADASDLILENLNKLILKINNLANSTAEKKLSAAVQQANDIARTSSDRLSSVESEMENAYNQIEDRTEVIDGLQEEIEKYRQNLSDLEKKLAVTESRSESVELENGRLINEVEELRQEIRDAQALNSDQFTKIANLNSKLESEESMVADLKRKAESESTIMEKKISEISELKSKIEISEKDKLEAISQGSANLRLLNDAQENMKEAKNELNSLRNKVSSLTASNGKLAGELTTLKTNRDKDETIISELNEKLQEANSFKISIGNENTRLRESQSKLNEEIGDIKKRNLTLERENAKLSKN